MFFKLSYFKLSLSEMNYGKPMIYLFEELPNWTEMIALSEKKGTKLMPLFVVLHGTLKRTSFVPLVYVFWVSSFTC